MGLEQLAGEERETYPYHCEKNISDTFFGGVMSKIFSARLEASMAPFNAEMASFLPLGRWDPVSIMVGTRGSCGRTVQLEDYEEGSEPQQR